VRDAIGVWKELKRGRCWEAVAAVERMRKSLLALRGQRDDLRLDPADPADALTKVVHEAASSFDLGSRRAALLRHIGLDAAPGRTPD
jgi:hypothetical protein